MTWPAIWHVAVFPNEADSEFPEVERPTFNRYPPPAYRLAEPGDTIDRIQIYLASLAIAFCATGLIRASNRRPWLAALAVALATFWEAANPGPTFDRWHGLGWSTLLNPQAPWPLRLALLISALAFALLFLYGVNGLRELSAAWQTAKSSRLASLLVVSAFFYGVGLCGLTEIEPFGYWPRWEMVWGLTGFASLLLLALQGHAWTWRSVARTLALCVPLWFACVESGITLTWYHRPLNRLREIVPGKIFISAMPTERGLEIAQKRHKFKTIINLFPENSRLRSPNWPSEMRFVKKRGLDYLGITSDPADVNGDDFLDLTLKTAQDPNAWPILVHCHGCMDRTPAWVGIYKFVVEGRPLLESFKFIEQHRGYRPKASVTVLYNRVLPRLAPERVKTDPIASRLGEFSRGQTRLDANLDETPRVSRQNAVDRLERRDAPSPRGHERVDASSPGIRDETALAKPLPSLTPRR